jgi:two-component system KDP operon response regulator KdpE
MPVLTWSPPWTSAPPTTSQSPFNIDELIARLRAVIRRTPTGAPPPAHPHRRRRATDAAVHLTPTEERLPDLLLRKAGWLITDRELLLAVGNGPDRTERSYLRIYLAQLRGKLEPVPCQPRHLITESGTGYRFIP